MRALLDATCAMRAIRQPRLPPDPGNTHCVEARLNMFHAAIEELAVWTNRAAAERATIFLECSAVRANADYARMVEMLRRYEVRCDRLGTFEEMRKVPPFICEAVRWITIMSGGSARYEEKARNGHAHACFGQYTHATSPMRRIVDLFADHESVYGLSVFAVRLRVIAKANAGREREKAHRKEKMKAVLATHSGLINSVMIVFEREMYAVFPSHSELVRINPDAYECDDSGQYVLKTACREMLLEKDFTVVQAEWYESDSAHKYYSPRLLCNSWSAHETGRVGGDQWRDYKGFDGWRRPISEISTSVESSGSQL